MASQGPSSPTSSHNALSLQDGVNQIPENNEQVSNTMNDKLSMNDSQQF